MNNNLFVLCILWNLNLYSAATNNNPKPAPLKRAFAGSWVYRNGTVYCFQLPSTQMPNGGYALPRLYTTTQNK